MANNCAACNQRITNRMCLNCSLCTGKYDLICVNVSEKRFSLMSKENKSSWICPQCRSKKPKQNNTNTPVRQHLHNESDDELNQSMQMSSSNITQRCKLPSQPNDNYSLLLEDTPPEGNTILLNSSASAENILLIELRELKSQINDQSKKQEMRDQELSKTIQLLQTTISNISGQYTSLESELKSLKITTEQNTNRINDLETENRHLKEQLKKSNESTSFVEPTVPVSVSQTYKTEEQTNHNKTIVLYGLSEDRYENEYILHDRIINIFYDIIGVDLSGNIEEINRIGRHGMRRPVKIELLSKITTKYLISCVANFKNTGLWLSKYLDEGGLQRRKKEKDNRRASRYDVYNRTSDQNQTNMENTNIKLNKNFIQENFASTQTPPQEKGRNNKKQPFRK